MAFSADNQKEMQGYAAILHDLLETAVVPMPKAQVYLDAKRWLETIIKGDTICALPTDVLWPVEPSESEPDEGEA